ncbi:hypothetical protein [Dyadobacter sp. 3J3]|uniref:hypothetical protein n=1 Tax=Dyadobacter sp. 3J3 TaxID=2606600 RepID=UPI00135B668C|nr:hypothetical protein [Dyadobacter sp. 3J3]
MKNQIMRISVILLYTFTISISEALPKNNVANGVTLLLNGKLATPEKFVYVTNGRLTMVDINAKPSPKTELPFFAYLRREGKIVDVNAYGRNFSVRSIELTEILKTAQVGDDIIIEPANKKDISGRKIIYVRYSMLFPIFNWFPFLNKNKGGC